MTFDDLTDICYRELGENSQLISVSLVVKDGNSGEVRVYNSNEYGGIRMKTKYSMAQYIDKDALVAEIEKFKENANKRGAIGKVSTIVLCNELLSFLDTLDELQECDFDTAIERYIGQHRGELRGYFDIRRIARHFFELGRFISYVSIKKKYEN